MKRVVTVKGDWATITIKIDAVDLSRPESMRVIDTATDRAMRLIEDLPYGCSTVLSKIKVTRGR